MTRGPVTDRSDVLRIGLVCPYSMQTPGGVQNHVLGLAGELTSLGHLPQVLAPGRLDPDRARAFGLRPDQVVDAGPAVPVPYNGSVARVNFGPASLLRVRRWLRSGEFDLLHVHEPLTPSISGWAFLLGTQRDRITPLVATFHTATPRSRTMALAGRVFAPAVRRIAAGVAVSESARSVVLRYLDRDAQVIPNGFRLDEFARATDHDRTGRRWRSADHPRIAFLGRLGEPRKGLDVLLDALPQLRAVHPDLEVLVAGAGRRRLPTDVRALGQVDDRVRAELFGTVDVFVAPHRARESFGIVLIEAMASGATVVASDLEPFTELLTDRQSADGSALGYQFGAGDARGLAEAVLQALAEDRHERNQRARDSTERYDWAHVGARILDVYHQALGSSPTATEPAPAHAPEPTREAVPEPVRS